MNHQHSNVSKAEFFTLHRFAFYSSYQENSISDWTGISLYSNIAIHLLQNGVVLLNLSKVLRTRFLATRRATNCYDHITKLIAYSRKQQTTEWCLTKSNKCPASCGPSLSLTLPHLPREGHEQQQFSQSPGCAPPAG